VHNPAVFALAERLTAAMRLLCARYSCWWGESTATSAWAMLYPWLPVSQRSSRFYSALTGSKYLWCLEVGAEG